jgi:hypothetical protein
VSSWWVSNGQTPVNQCALSRDGFFVEANGDDVICAWLYVNNSSNVAVAKHMVTNPDASGETVALARAMLCDFLKSQCDKIGKILEIEEPFDFQVALQSVDAPENFIDQVELKIMGTEEIDFPLTHSFTPGMYIRQILMPAGSILTSKIHKTTHPFVISKGDISVWTKETDTVRFKAPHTGITIPNTRRLLYAHEDTIWTTFHATNETDVETIENTITDLPINRLIKGE